ncbi:hypothetical protein G6F24_014059 [Rhizopus arrhizus]|nr:hypothetical protein G6F24_014059 [Rhizopus arrhizus]
MRPAGWRLLRLTVVELTGFLGHREIHVHAHFRVDPAGAGHRFQQFADALVERGFLAAHLLDLGGVDRSLAVRIADAEHAAALVDHGHPFRRKVRDAGRDHVHDGVDLAAFQLLPATQLQRYRGAGHVTLAGKGAGLGNGQVHARIAHRPQRVDGARQFGFQRVLVARAFHELADAEAGVAFHQLEAELAAVGQARSGQLQAGVVQVLFRHGDATGGRVERERDLRGAQQVSSNLGHVHHAWASGATLPGSIPVG